MKTRITTSSVVQAIADHHAKPLPCPHPFLPSRAVTLPIISSALAASLVAASCHEGRWRCGPGSSACRTNQTQTNSALKRIKSSLLYMNKKALYETLQVLLMVQKYIEAYIVINNMNDVQVAMYKYASAGCRNIGSPQHSELPVPTECHRDKASFICNPRFRVGCEYMYGYSHQYVFADGKVEITHSIPSCKVERMNEPT